MTGFNVWKTMYESGPHRLSWHWSTYTTMASYAGILYIKVHNHGIICRYIVHKGTQTIVHFNTKIVLVINIQLCTCNNLSC